MHAAELIAAAACATLFSLGVEVASSFSVQRPVGPLAKRQPRPVRAWVTYKNK